MAVMLQQLQPVQAQKAWCSRPSKVPPRVATAALSRRTVLGALLSSMSQLSGPPLQQPHTHTDPQGGGKHAATAYCQDPHDAIFTVMQEAYAAVQDVPAATGANGTTRTLHTTWRSA
jgi:hypothetical protein